MKSYSIAHYTITTSLGIRRYLSFLLCYEPIVLQHSASAVTIQLQPFAFVMVQSMPAFKFGKDILKGIFEASLIPYYYMLC